MGVIFDMAGMMPGLCWISLLAYAPWCSYSHLACLTKPVFYFFNFFIGTDWSNLYCSPKFIPLQKVCFLQWTETSFSY